MAAPRARIWAAAVLLVGCGGESSNSGSASPPAHTAGQAASTKVASAGSPSGVAAGGQAAPSNGGSPTTVGGTTSATTTVVSNGGTFTSANSSVNRGGQTNPTSGGASTALSSSLAVGATSNAGKSATSGLGGSSTGGKNYLGGAAGMLTTGGKNYLGGAAGMLTTGGKTNLAGAAQGPVNDDTTKDPFARSPDSGVLITSSDGLNSTEIVLAPDSQDGMFIAGATRNPKAMGLTAFDDGIVSEAFAARLDSQGKLVWSVPLKKCGVPADIATGPADSLYVTCANEPDTTTLMPSSCASTALVNKLDGANGQVLFETQLKNPSSTDVTLCPYGIGVDSAGRSYVGGLSSDDGFKNQRAIVIGVTAAGQQDWVYVAKGAESTTVDNAVAYTNDVDVDKDGNVLLAGAFNTWVEFGTTRLTSDAKSDRYSMYNGFIARLSSGATNATGWKFGGKVFDYAKSIEPTSDGGFIVGGSVSTSATIGGKTVAASPDGSAFVARLTSDGQSSWAIALPTKSYLLNLAQASDQRVHFVGNFLQGELFYTYDPRLNQLTSRKLVAGDSTINALHTSGIAVSTSGTLWLSGTFSGTVDLGTGPLSTSSVTAFLWRVRAPFDGV